MAARTDASDMAKAFEAMAAMHDHITRLRSLLQDRGYNGKACAVAGCVEWGGPGWMYECPDCNETLCAAHSVACTRFCSTQGCPAMGHAVRQLRGAWSCAAHVSEHAA